MTNKICIISVYFGSLPNYFPLWRRTAANNPTVDFIIFTDQQVNALADNVKIVPMTLAEMRERASKELEFEACLATPYKCCDYKPLYGVIFSDFVGHYDYWGHCDLDLMFGDLQAFFDRYHLYDYDRFLALGHLSLYRNTAEVNSRYRCDGSWKDYKTVFSSPEIFVFDELPGMTALYQKNGFSIFVGNLFADIGTVHHRFVRGETYPLDKPVENASRQTFYWENGKTFRAAVTESGIVTEEFLYIHFQKRPNFEIPDDVWNGNAFYITPNGFVAKRGEVTAEDIDATNPYPGARKERWELFRFRAGYYKKAVARRLKRIFKGK